MGNEGNPQALLRHPDTHDGRKQLLLHNEEARGKNGTTEAWKVEIGSAGQAVEH